MTSYFYLLPGYWVAGILLYASSPWQKITDSGQAIVAKWQAAIGLGIVLFASIFFMYNTSGLAAESLAFVLVLTVLSIPGPALLLNHKPQWCIQSIIAAVVLSALLHIIAIR